MSTFAWIVLLTNWNETILSSSEKREYLPPKLIASGWLGKPGATEEQIAQVEKRLKVTLPPSYRAFLKTTNGWRASTASVENLLPVSKIGWFAKKHKDWLDAWFEGVNYGNDFYGPPPPVADAEYFVYGDEQDTTVFRDEYLQTALAISDGEDGIYLLNPQIIDKDGEWEAWFFANWLPGAVRYRSFWELMQEEYRTLQRLSAHEEKRLFPQDSPETVVEKLPGLPMELQEKADLWRSSLAKKNNPTTPRYEQGIIEGIGYAETRTRTLQENAHTPEELLEGLHSLADELEYRCTNQVVAWENAIGTEFTQLSVMQQLQVKGVPEGYREALGIIRWFLNEPP